MPETNLAATKARKHKRLDIISLPEGHEAALPVGKIFESMTAAASKLGKIAVYPAGAAHPHKMIFCVAGKEECDELLAAVNAVEARWLGEEPTMTGEGDSDVSALLYDNLRAVCKHIKHSGERGFLYFNTETKKGVWIAATEDKKNPTRYTSADSIEAMFMRVEGVEDFQILYDEDFEDESSTLVWPT